MEREAPLFGRANRSFSDVSLPMFTSSVAEMKFGRSLMSVSDVVDSMGAPFVSGEVVENESSHVMGRPPFPRFAPFTHATAALGRARLSTAYVSSAYTAQVGGCFFGRFASHAASLFFLPKFEMATDGNSP